MRSGIKNIAFLVLVFIIFVGGHLMAANKADWVEVDGDRLSVRVGGMALGDILMAIEDLTGVHFGFDELIAKRETFVDFEDLSLSEGIKKIIFPLSCALIYDETGKLRKVVILGRGKDLAMGEPREVENRASESYQPGSPPGVLSTTRRGSDISTRSKVHPSIKRRLQFDDTPADSKKAEYGPPLNKPYSLDGPPNAQNQILEDSPDGGSSDNPPPPDSMSSSMEGPSLDKTYSVDGPPSSEDLAMEGPPGAGSAKE